MEDWTGRVLSKVRIEKLIGRGGMADVYVGRHMTLNRPMAVKILHPHMTVNADLRRRFRDEAQAVAALRHPNIVQVIDFDVIDDRPYIVMELLEGMPLNDYLRGLHSVGHTLPLESVSRMMTSLTSALDYAHDQQIVHRDVKPANIILRAGETPIKAQMPLASDVEPVLTDFGVARIATSTTPTASGTILGTPAYMSPEQVRGEPVDRRSDIYALGIILYEILAGRLPFNPETDTPASILYKHVHEDPPVVPNVSPSIQRVVEKSLAKDKVARYQKAGQLAADLKIATKSSTVAAPAAPAVTAAATTPPLLIETPAPSLPERRFSPSLALIAGIAIGVTVLVGGVGLGSRVVGGPKADIADLPAPTEAAETVATEAPATTEDIATQAPTAVSQGESEPVAAAIVLDSSLEAQIPDVEAPQAGQAYHAWLLGDEGTEALQLNLDGSVELVADELSVSYDHPDALNLLSIYSTFVVSLEEEGSLLEQPENVVFQGGFDPGATQLVQLVDDEKGGEPVIANLATWLPLQADHFYRHSGLALVEVENENLAATKAHSEHSINIIEGITGELFGDWDGDNNPVNPGDPIGVIPYLTLLQVLAEGGAKAESLRGGTGDAAGEIAARSSEIEHLFLSLRETIRQIALVDSVEDIAAFGLDSDLEIQREAKTLIDQLMQDAQAVDLAFAIDIFRSQ
jgi:serine/threonine-protein kinase